MSLPLQFFHCQHNEFYKTVRSNGTFFTSAYIKYLLNPDDNQKPINVATQIQQHFIELKALFQNILVDQIKFESSDIYKVEVNENQLFSIIQRSLDDYIKAIRYFNTDYTSCMTFIAGDDVALPNLRQLIIQKECWNLESVELPNDIYKKYKYFYYYSSSSLCEKGSKLSVEDTESRKYGPVDDGFYIFQFERDFLDCLEINLSKYGMASRFDYGLNSVNEVYTKETLELFTQFRMANLRPYINENNGRGIMALYNLILHNLNSNFSDTENHRLIFLHCCELAIATITKAWDGVFIF